MHQNVCYSKINPTRSVLMIFEVKIKLIILYFVFIQKFVFVLYESSCYPYKRSCYTYERNFKKYERIYAKVSVNHMKMTYYPYQCFDEVNERIDHRRVYVQTCMLYYMEVRVIHMKCTSI